MQPLPMQCPSGSTAPKRVPEPARHGAEPLRPPRESPAELAEQALPRMHHALDVLNLEDGALLEGRSASETEYLRAVAQWSRDYLTRPHPELGRPGSVCPWVEKSIQRRLYHLTLQHEAHRHADEVERTFHQLRRHFQQMAPADFNQGQFKAIVTIFTGLPQALESEFISALHERLKPPFVKEGLMLGEFYATCPKTGLRNPGWHPLRSSPPLLVIRTMVRPDIAFLTNNREFVRTYLSRFRQEGGTELRHFIERNQARLAPENVSMLQQTLREFQEQRTE
jgi:hypothetical protein